MSRDTFEKLVEEGLKKGVLVKNDGAVIFQGEDYGLHTRVFVNKLGLPTYEAKDFGLAPAKYQDFKYDASLIVTGKEIKEYFHVVLKVMRLIVICDNIWESQSLTKFEFFNNNPKSDFIYSEILGLQIKLNHPLFADL